MKLNVFDEHWMEMKGFEDKYLISDYGRIISKRRNEKRKGMRFYDNKESFLVCPTGSNGYRKVCINRKHYNIHRLVAINFISNPNNYPVINHKDGNPLNNHISNLEWCTHQHNIKHAYEILGRKSPACRLVLNIENGIYFDSVKEACENIPLKFSAFYCQLNSQNRNTTQYILV